MLSYFFFREPLIHFWKTCLWQPLLEKRLQFKCVQFLLKLHTLQQEEVFDKGCAKNEKCWVAASCGCRLANIMLKVSEDMDTVERQHRLRSSFDTSYTNEQRFLTASYSKFIENCLFSFCLSFLLLREKKEEVCLMMIFSRRQTEIT